MDLNTILIILGVIALIALVVHGLWSNRREKSKYFKSANTFNRTSKNGEVNPFSQAADPNADIRLTHRAQAAQPVQQHVQPKVASQPLRSDAVQSEIFTSRARRSAIAWLAASWSAFTLSVRSATFARIVAS